MSSYAAPRGVSGERGGPTGPLGSTGLRREGQIGFLALLTASGRGSRCRDDTRRSGERPGGKNPCQESTEREKASDSIHRPYAHRERSVSRHVDRFVLEKLLGTDGSGDLS